jgi:hypothetical protein
MAEAGQGNTSLLGSTLFVFVIELLPNCRRRDDAAGQRHGFAGGMEAKPSSNKPSSNVMICLILIVHQTSNPLHKGETRLERLLQR